MEEGAQAAGRERPALVAHVPVVVSEDADAVWEAAQGQLGFYPRLPYYSAMWQDAGFPEAEGGTFSRAMSDALVIQGSEEAVAERVRALPSAGVNEMLAGVIRLESESRPPPTARSNCWERSRRRTSAPLPALPCRLAASPRARAPVTAGKRATRALSRFAPARIVEGQNAVPRRKAPGRAGAFTGSRPAPREETPERRLADRPVRDRRPRAARAWGYHRHRRGNGTGAERCELFALAEGTTPAAHEYAGHLISQAERTWKSLNLSLTGALIAIFSEAQHSLMDWNTRSVTAASRGARPGLSSPARAIASCSPCAARRASSTPPGTRSRCTSPTTPMPSP